uniref:Uncharacterized protein n=1 Tax=Anguilla anguilla TaxID=7936 RepID=A0A0E9W8W0_ANGAN
MTPSSDIFVSGFSRQSSGFESLPAHLTAVRYVYRGRLTIKLSKNIIQT